MRSERFPHKPYIQEGFPKNATVAINDSITFKCPMIVDLEPFIQWLKVNEYPDDHEKSPKGKLLQVLPQLCATRWRYLIKLIVKHKFYVFPAQIFYRLVGG